MFDENLKKQFFNMYKFLNHDIGKLISLLLEIAYSDK